MFVLDLIHYDIRCRNALLIDETFLPFEVQQILQLPIYVSQLQDEFMWGASRYAIFFFFCEDCIPFLRDKA